MRLLVFLFPVIASPFFGPATNQAARRPGLEYFFDGGYGQVEVGGRYVGMEFHDSRPLPSRISFYYPVANSIDLSTDYWQRGSSRPMALGIRVGVGRRRWIGREAWQYTLSPHTVTFHRQSEGLSYEIRYEFCLNAPAAVMTVTIRNNSNESIPLELYTHLRFTLRTCQTYARLDRPMTEHDTETGAIAAHFDAPESDSATVFVLNDGLGYSTWTTWADEVAATDSGTSNWLQRDFHSVFPRGGRHRAVAAFTYETTVSPGDSVVLVQVIGSCRRNEWERIVGKLLQSRRDEVTAYDRFVRAKAFGEAMFVTGDSVLDQSAVWARALIAANAHYLDGHIVPMPCPAEYNFFFTHDLLVTNLGAVNFDLVRVKSDLLYVASLSKGAIIPHAYYWKDDGFKTEYCTPDNWNHLWFVLVTGSYLRHSFDDSTGQALYPLVSKSVEELLKQKREDNLMYAFRPDWWDIGHVEGLRAYLTILAIRALREYLFISTTLGKFSSSLKEYERVADAMQAALTAQLWDNKLAYLMDKNGDVSDRHYYMGPLLAPVFGLLGDSKAEELVATATRELVDSCIGVRTVMPPDFHTKQSTAFYKFAGDEAGQPYYYLNGGVWPHTNAWYALALKSVGKTDEALRFVKSIMTLDGVAQSPLGVPAMYEYRFSDPSSAEFGKIDKPSFLWAGGFFLYTLYNLFGIKENEWNVSLAGPLPSGYDSVKYSLGVGGLIDVVVEGKGERLHRSIVDGVELPSLVLPNSVKGHSSVRVTFGQVVDPYLQSVNAILREATWDEQQRVLKLEVSSFGGHNIAVDLVSIERPASILLDGKKVSDVKTSESADGVRSIRIIFVASSGRQRLEVRF